MPEGLWGARRATDPELPAVGRGRYGGVEDRAVFAAIVYVLTCGCAWRPRPGKFGVSVPAAHRRVHRLNAGGIVAAAAPRGAG
ncbi:transposase [Actinomadura litoris]|uniref:transposase n=1 Tax=Actinomadura litoris TaxID=2678616 RepID=UPI0035584D0E